MTDIDITAAIEAAKDTLLESPALGCGCCAWPDDLYESREEQAATEAITAALPHILAQVERVKPTREDVARALDNELGPFLSYNPERFWGQPADAVLALLPGRTETEVREQVAQELLSDASGRPFPYAYVRLMNPLRGEPPVRTFRAAVEILARGIARGGER